MKKFSLSFLLILFLSVPLITLADHDEWKLVSQGEFRTFLSYLKGVEKMDRSKRDELETDAKSYLRRIMSIAALSTFTDYLNSHWSSTFDRKTKEEIMNRAIQAAKEGGKNRFLSIVKTVKETSENKKPKTLKALLLLTSNEGNGEVNIRWYETDRFLAENGDINLKNVYFAGNVIKEEERKAGDPIQVADRLFPDEPEKRLTLQRNEKKKWDSILALEKRKRENDEEWLRKHRVSSSVCGQQHCDRPESNGMR